MCQNYSISFLVDPGGGGKNKFAHLAHPRYDYDMQSRNYMFHQPKLRPGLHAAPESPNKIAAEVLYGTDCGLSQHVGK